MEYSFQKIVLSPDQRLWLNEVHSSGDFDVRKTKVKLFGKIAADFDVQSIDNRLLRHDHLTLIGLWLVDPSSPMFSVTGKVIERIKEMIFLDPELEQVAAAEISGHLGFDEQEVGVALRLMDELGKFVDTASYSNNGKGYSLIRLSRRDDGFDAYLSYKSLNELMESFFTRKPPKVPSVKLPNWWGAHQIPENSSVEEVIKRQNTAFVIMPIDPDNSLMVDVYSGIKEVCAKFGIDAIRADDIEHQESITEVVLRQISECEFLIADLSHERPNVYYEIGYAHAINKHPILYRSQGTKLHFDLAVHNVPEYKNATELKVKLEKRFEEILGRKAK